MYHRLVVASAFSGEVSEPAEGARLLSEYTGLNLYRGFKSLPLRHLEHFCFENAPGVKRSETPPRPPLLRCHRNSLAAYNSGGGVKAVSRNTGFWPADTFNSKMLWE